MNIRALFDIRYILNQRAAYFSDPVMLSLQKAKQEAIKVSTYVGILNLSTGKMSFELDQATRNRLNYIEDMLECHQKTYYPELFKTEEANDIRRKKI